MHNQKYTKNIFFSYDGGFGALGRKAIIVICAILGLLGCYQQGEEKTASLKMTGKTI
jgi:hypothetical protein